MIFVCRCFFKFWSLSFILTLFLSSFSLSLYSMWEHPLSEDQATIMKMADAVDANLLLNPQRLFEHTWGIMGLRILYMVVGEHIVLRRYLKNNGIETMPHFSNGQSVISETRQLQIFSFHEQFMVDMEQSLEKEYIVVRKGDGSGREIYPRHQRKKVLLAQLINIYTLDFDQYVRPLILYPELFTSRMTMEDMGLNFRCMSEFGCLREGFEQLTWMAIKLSKDPIFANGGRDFHLVYNDANKIKQLSEIVSFKKKLYFFVRVLLGNVKDNLNKVDGYEETSLFITAFKSLMAMIIFHKQYNMWVFLDACKFGLDIILENTEGNEPATLCSYNGALESDFINKDIHNNTKMLLLKSSDYINASNHKSNVEWEDEDWPDIAMANSNSYNNSRDDIQQNNMPQVDNLQSSIDQNIEETRSDAPQFNTNVTKYEDPDTQKKQHEQLFDASTKEVGACNIRENDKSKNINDHKLVVSKPTYNIKNNKVSDSKEVKTFNKSQPKPLKWDQLAVLGKQKKSSFTPAFKQNIKRSDNKTSQYDQNAGNIGSDNTSGLYGHDYDSDEESALKYILSSCSDESRSRKKSKTSGISNSHKSKSDRSRRKDNTSSYQIAQDLDGVLPQEPALFKSNAPAAVKNNKQQEAIDPTLCSLNPKKGQDGEVCQGGKKNDLIISKQQEHITKELPKLVAEGLQVFRQPEEAKVETIDTSKKLKSKRKQQAVTEEITPLGPMKTQNESFPEDKEAKRKKRKVPENKQKNVLNLKAAKQTQIDLNETGSHEQQQTSEYTGITNLECKEEQNTMRVEGGKLETDRYKNDEGIVISKTTSKAERTQGGDRTNEWGGIKKPKSKKNKTEVKKVDNLDRTSVELSETKQKGRTVFKEHQELACNEQNILNSQELKQSEEKTVETIECENGKESVSEEISVSKPEDVHSLIVPERIEKKSRKSKKRRKQKCKDKDNEMKIEGLSINASNQSGNIITETMLPEVQHKPITPQVTRANPVEVQAPAKHENKKVEYVISNRMQGSIAKRIESFGSKESKDERQTCEEKSQRERKKNLAMSLQMANVNTQCSVISNKKSLVSFVLVKGNEQDIQIVNELNESLCKCNKAHNKCFFQHPPTILLNVEEAVKSELERRNNTASKNMPLMLENKMDVLKKCNKDSRKEFFEKNALCEIAKDEKDKLQKCDAIKKIINDAHHKDAEVFNDNEGYENSYDDTFSVLCSRFKYVVKEKKMCCLYYTSVISAMFFITYYLVANETVTMTSTVSIILYLCNYANVSFEVILPSVLGMIPLLGIYELFVFSFCKKKSFKTKAIVRCLFELSSFMGQTAGRYKVFAGPIPRNRASLEFYCQPNYFEADLNNDVNIKTFHKYLWVLENEFDNDKKYLFNKVDYSSKQSYPIPVLNYLREADKYCLIKKMKCLMKKMLPEIKKTGVTAHRIIREDVLLPFSLSVKALAFKHVIAFDETAISNTIEYMLHNLGENNLILQFLDWDIYQEFGNPRAWQLISEPEIKISREFKKIVNNGKKVIVSLPCFYVSEPGMEYIDMMNNCLPMDFNTDITSCAKPVDPAPVPVIMDSGETAFCLGGLYHETMKHQPVEVKDLGNGDGGLKIPKGMDGVYMMGCLKGWEGNQVYTSTWVNCKYNNEDVWSGLYESILTIDSE